MRSMVEGSGAMTATDQAYKNARGFRRKLSLPELLLWRRLKGQKPRFRRQHPIGPYVLDFYCAAAKLAIEVDGAAHDMGDRPRRDEVRTKWLNGEGIEVLRIPAKDVLADPDSVADALLRLCSARAKPLHHSPLASGPPPQPLAREEQSTTDSLLPASGARGEGDRDAQRRGGGVE